jgi:osmotically inducible protein OsmC
LGLASDADAITSSHNLTATCAEGCRIALPKVDREEETLMPTRTAHARWEGNLQKGKGTMTLGSGAFEGAYSYGTRFEDAAGTNPEELIGAAHAGCFSMAFSMLLDKAGHPPKDIKTRADVTLEKVGDGFKITRVELHTEAVVAGIGTEEFRKQAEAAKKGCPVSQALAGTEIELKAELKGTE